MRKSLSITLFTLALSLAVVSVGLSSAAPSSVRARSGFDCGDISEILESECEALVALYSATDGDNWTNNTGWMTTDTPCSWHGVACQPGHVTGLFLADNQLTGHIPPEIGDLTELTTLHLYRNQLTGPIPPETGNLTALESLSLFANRLSGLIPGEIGNLTALTWLSLNHNQFSGPIPAEIGNLSGLNWLMLNNNELSGPVPAEIGNLTALKELRLGRNGLNDPIPAQMANLSALEHLSIHRNWFSGEIPAFLTALTQLNHFDFYDTDLCVPLAGDVPAWLAGLPSLYGTGLICGEDFGSLSGEVVLADKSPASGVEVTIYRSLSERGHWRHIGTVHTTIVGTYQFQELAQGLGVDYRVQFVDPSHSLAAQFYQDRPTISEADLITITPGIPRTGIDAVLALPLSPAVEVEVTTGSVLYHADGTAQITMPAPDLGDITVTRIVTCTVGTPTHVVLRLSTETEYPMTPVGGDRYVATVPAADLIDSATLSVAASCNGITTTTVVAHLMLYDPSGTIIDALSGQPVAGAMVTLYHVPGWGPKSGPDDERPNTCESNLSKPADAPWSQPAPTDLGTIANSDVNPTDPPLPYQQTTEVGYYGWDVSRGCWYVTVEAESYESLVSPVVGVPPEVVDLDLALTPLAEEGFAIFLPLVLRNP